MLRLRDTLTGAKVDVEPRQAGKLAIYVCGPTVYDVPHLGHARAALVFDVIRRYLAWCGIDVTYVSNVTDVDDKIIMRAQREGVSEGDVARRYEDSYWAELDRLGVLRPDHVPHATEYIADMVRLIERLIDLGRAYAKEDGDGASVYFSVGSYEGYGELAHRRIDDLLDTAGARVEVDETKRSPLDFALWKAAKPGEPSWDSPWGRGRPGWHIECSAMASKLLGEGFDIHGGGSDLVFPHHENERAQSEGSGERFARYWIHWGMVMAGAEKMSKSLGNFTSLPDALDRHDARALRLCVLQTHYRSDMQMGGDELAGAERALAGLDNLVRRVATAGLDVAGAAPDDEVRAAFRDAMDDDFNSPGAMAVLFDAVRRANAALDAGDNERAASLVATVTELTAALGLAIGGQDRGAGDDDAAEIDALVAERDAARAARDFAAADRIRAELADRGITLEDTAAGTTWHR